MPNLQPISLKRKESSLDHPSPADHGLLFSRPGDSLPNRERGPSGRIGYLPGAGALSFFCRPHLDGHFRPSLPPVA